MKQLTGWKLTMIIAAIVSLGASVFESNTGEAVPMLKEVAQSCYIVAIVPSALHIFFRLLKKERSKN